MQGEKLDATIQIEVAEIWPAPVDHLRLAVRSVCPAQFRKCQNGS